MSSGNSQLCAEYQALGIHMAGGFAEYVLVPAKAVASGNVTPIPDGVSFRAAAVNEPLSCAFNGSERCGIRPGDTVVIIGAGPIGIMHAMLAEMAGAGCVIVNDLSAEPLARMPPGQQPVCCGSVGYKGKLYGISHPVTVRMCA